MKEVKLPKIINEIKSGVVCFTFYKKGERVNSGTGFIVKDHLVSCNHVFFDDHRQPLNGTEVRIRFGDMANTVDDVYRVSYEEFMKKLVVGSPEDGYDYAVFKVDDLDTRGKYQYELGTHLDTEIGDGVLILGYPFGQYNLTTHFGYVSSIYNDGTVDIIQLDASTNNGNSGGPVYLIKDNKVVSYVTRKQTGLAKQFDELIDSFDNNIAVLSKLHSVITWGDLKLTDIFAASQRQMKSIAQSIKRSANTGIGFSFSCSKLIEEEFYKD